MEKEIFKLEVEKMRIKIKEIEEQIKKQKNESEHIYDDNKRGNIYQKEEGRNRQIIRGPNGPCFICGKYGHINRDCNERIVQKTLSIVCGRCGNTGHNAEKCYVSTLKIQENERKVTSCSNCGRTGHTLDKCFRREQTGINAFPSVAFPLVKKGLPGTNIKNEYNDVIPKETKNEGNNAQVITCFRCRNIEHYARDCIIV
ncbi:uncharacterized protein LOC135930155 [Gordionus sp. m RMFG-2023]|uniref:uncharacterized protein LOC135930155 n=1 Tax=Gordionus sp. m RMFG-2023 TaxID=3053472 RepID=UPI0031FCAE77